jgi:hypothetical protein
MNIAEKYYWIVEHPKYVPFASAAIIEITPHMVCPETNRVEKLQFMNTKLQFWAELMIPHFDKQFNQHCHAHDWELDCGGDTWEEAVENLYQLVIQKYGDYTEEDKNNHRKEAMKGFNFDEWMASHEFVEASILDDGEIKMLPDYEIEKLQADLEEMEQLLPVLKKKIQDPSLTMEQHSEVELEIICVDADIYNAKESIRLGYDVQKYGIRDEDHKADTHTS